MTEQTRLRGEEQPGFSEILSSWLPHQPWYPAPRGRRTLTRVGGLRLPTPPGDADAGLLLELHVFDVDHPEGSERIAVPVTLRSRPSALAGKSAFIGKLSTEEHGELWVYDGARDRAFLAAWLEMARRRQGSRNGRSRGEPYAGFDEWEPFTVELRRSLLEAPSEEITRTAVTAGEDDGGQQVVVDFIRRPRARFESALDVVLTLTKAYSTAVPRVLGTVSGAWRQRVPEGEAPVWEAGPLAVIREAAVASPEAWTLAKSALQEGKSFEEEARKLGLTLGTFHADLAGSFGAHPQTSAQLKSMAQNAQKALSDQWKRVRGEFDEDEAADLSEVIDLMTMQLRDADELLALQHIHGTMTAADLHRMTEDRWVVAEPQEILEHAFGLRDVVTVMMSLANMVMQVAAESPELTQSGEAAAEDAGEQPQEPVNFGQWYEDLTRSFLAGYRESDVDTAGVDSVFFRAAMLTEALELFSQWEGQWVFRPSMLMQAEG